MLYNNLGFIERGVDIQMIFNLTRIIILFNFLFVSLIKNNDIILHQAKERY